MNEQIESVVTPHIQAGQGIIEGKRQIEDRPAAYALVWRWRQRAFELMDRGVVLPANALLFHSGRGG